MNYKGVYLSLFLIVFHLAHSQNRSKKPDEARTQVIECFYGNTIYSNSFYNQINTTSSFKPNMPLTYIGIQSPNYGYILDPRHSLNFFSFLKILPAKIHATDSLSFNVNGFNFSMSVWDHNFFKRNKKIDLYVGVGIHTGQLRMNSSMIDQKNPVFAPQILIYNNYIIKRVSLSIFGSYFYDVSKPGWRKTWFGNKDFVTVNSFNQSGFRVGLGIGWAF